MLLPLPQLRNTVEVQTHFPPVKRRSIQSNANRCCWAIAGDGSRRVRRIQEDGLKQTAQERGCNTGSEGHTLLQPKSATGAPACCSPVKKEEPPSFFVGTRELQVACSAAHRRHDGVSRGHDRKAQGNAQVISAASSNEPTALLNLTRH